MNWILEHLQIVVMLAAAFAYWLKQTNDKAEKEGENGASPLSPASSSTEEQAERTRQIQEEIRRKIAERRAGAAAPLPPSATPSERPGASSTLAPRPVARSAGGTLRERMEAKMTEALKRIEDAAKAAAEREQNQKQERRQPARPSEAEITSREAERLAAERRATVEELAERERERRMATTALPSMSILKETEAVPVARSVRDDLRDPGTIRRAWLLREVLGTPAGLR